jgi:hypothetical protein
VAVVFDQNNDAIEPLEAALADVLYAANLRGRQARAVAARLGWDGEGVRTLALAAEPEGYSRERVRQLEERVRAVGGHSRATTATIAAALRLIEAAAPITPRDASVLLAEAGISRCPFEIGGLLSAADITDVQHSLRLRDGMIVLWGRPRPVAVPEPAMVTR